jgi:hypothetical protein
MPNPALVTRIAEVAVRLLPVTTAAQALRQAAIRGDQKHTSWVTHGTASG